MNTVYASALAEVKRLKSLHSTYEVKTTGHSLGGALAQLTAMSLLADGISVSMINFG
jgi:putative lipase involved disintegration of autophagic bodies